MRGAYKPRSFGDSDVRDSSLIRHDARTRCHTHPETMCSSITSRRENDMDEQVRCGHALRAAVRERGQSTVEYVGLAVAVAVLLVAVGGGLSGHGDKLGGAVAKRLQEAVAATK